MIHLLYCGGTDWYYELTDCSDPAHIVLLAEIYSHGAAKKIAEAYGIEIEF